MAVVEEAGETVLVAVVREAAVVEEAAGENAGPGRPQHWNQKKMKHYNLLRMRSILKWVAFRRSCVSRGSEQAIELTEKKPPCYKVRSRLACEISHGEVERPDSDSKTIIDSGA